MERQNNMDDVVISSRIRLARNLREYPFHGRISREQELEVIRKVKEAAFTSSGAAADTLLYMDLKEMSPLERQALVEKHLISPDIAGSGREVAAIVSKDERISIMINEEDHLRIQCLFPGARLEEAWQLCSRIDRLMEEKMEFAFSQGFGYLTCCPTNAGTGIRASAMLHLPALVMTGYIRGVLEACGKLGVAVRGLYGENTEALGNMFQISNQVTLGRSEEEIIAGVNSVISQISSQERILRDELRKQNPYRFEDRIFRSFGLISNARIISTEESLKLLSDVRLGLDMGIIKGVEREVLEDIMGLIHPALLQKSAGKALNPEERDIQRAELIRRRLGFEGKTDKG